jgi:hypothetical protein
VTDRNWPLLIKVAMQIMKHPETWNQGSWVTPCGTAFCFGGHAVNLSGYEFVKNRWGRFADLVKVPEGTPWYGNAWNNEWPEGDEWSEGDGMVIDVRSLAPKLLGLNGEESDRLFRGVNHLVYVLRLLAEWAADDGVELPELLRLPVPPPREVPTRITSRDGT